MELKEFVKEVLVQLCEGVSDAQKEVVKVGGVVCPKEIRYKEQNAVIGGKDLPLETVFFEVGLVSESKEGKSKGIGVHLSAICFGGKSTDEVRAETVTRIKFSVPLVLPAVDGNNKQTINHTHI